MYNYCNKDKFFMNCHKILFIANQGESLAGFRDCIKNGNIFKIKLVYIFIIR